MIIKNIVASFFLVFTLFPVSGQNIDSLKALLVGKTGSSRADILFDISFNILKVDKRLALKYAVEGYHLSLKLNDSLRAVRTGLVA